MQLELRGVKFNGEGTMSTGDLASSTALPTPPDETNFVLLQAEGANVRLLFAGGTATASTGMVLVASDPPLMLTMLEADILQIRVIRETSGAVLHYAYGYDPNVRLNG